MLIVTANAMLCAESWLFMTVGVVWSSMLQWTIVWLLTTYVCII